MRPLHPGLRDAFNIATLIADTRFVDKAYVRTEIDDEVQIVELTRESFTIRQELRTGGSGDQLAAVIPPAPFPHRYLRHLLCRSTGPCPNGALAQPFACGYASRACYCWCAVSDNRDSESSPQPFVVLKR